MKLIETNNYLLKEKIFSQIHTKIKDFNKNSDKKSFEIIRQNVDDYELTYKYYHNNGLFLKLNQEERIDKINDAIKIRKNANNQFKSSDNQRLITIRYIELGNEMQRMGKNSEIIEYYKLSIFWNLSAFKHYIMNN